MICLGIEKPQPYDGSALSFFSPEDTMDIQRHECYVSEFNQHEFPFFRSATMDDLELAVHNREGVKCSVDCLHSFQTQVSIELEADRLISKARRLFSVGHVCNAFMLLNWLTGIWTKRPLWNWCTKKAHISVFNLWEKTLNKIIICWMDHCGEHQKV